MPYELHVTQSHVVTQLKGQSLVQRRAHASDTAFIRVPSCSQVWCAEAPSVAVHQHAITLQRHPPTYPNHHVLSVQVHSLLNVVRPDRQTLLFSATLPRKIESLVAEALSNPVRISVGLLGAANADVSQRVEIMKGKLNFAGQLQACRSPQHTCIADSRVVYCWEQRMHTVLCLEGFGGVG